MPLKTTLKTSYVMKTAFTNVPFGVPISVGPLCFAIPLIFCVCIRNKSYVSRIILPSRMTRQVEKKKKKNAHA